MQMLTLIAAMAITGVGLHIGGVFDQPAPAPAEVSA